MLLCDYHAVPDTHTPELLEGQEEPCTVPHSATGLFHDLNIITNILCISFPSLKRARLHFLWTSPVCPALLPPGSPRELTQACWQLTGTSKLKPRCWCSSAVLSYPKSTTWSHTDISQDLTSRQYLSSPLHPQITRTIKTRAISLMPKIFLVIYSKLSGMGIGSDSGREGGHTYWLLPPLPLRQEAE